MPQNAATPRHLLVIDPRQPGWSSLLAAAGEDMAVLVLDLARDGLVQSVEVAVELAPLESIALVGPCGAGSLTLGMTVLEPGTMQERGWVLAALGATLLPEGRLEVPHMASHGAVGGRLTDMLARALGRDLVVADCGPSVAGRATAVPRDGLTWNWAPRCGPEAGVTALR